MATTASMVLCATSTSPTVDYDENATSLYEAIGNADWETATQICLSAANNPSQRNEAAIWVVRYQRDDQGNKLPNNAILWRFLPIHSACALNPPVEFLRALVKAYPDGPRTVDDQGMHPLHYACGARASREVIYLLLMSFPQAAARSDPNGMLPLHYLAQWGPSSMGVLDMLLVASGRMGNALDKDGNSPYLLATRGDYSDCNQVAGHIHAFLVNKGLVPGGNQRSGSRGSGTGDEQSFVSREVIGATTVTPRSGHGGGGASRAGDAPPSSNHSFSDASSFKRNLVINVNTAADKYASFEDDITETVAPGWNPDQIYLNHGVSNRITGTTNAGSTPPTQFEPMASGEIELSLSQGASENRNNSNHQTKLSRGSSWSNLLLANNSPSNGIEKNHHHKLSSTYGMNAKVQSWSNRSVSSTPTNQHQPRRMSFTSENHANDIVDNRCDHSILSHSPSRKMHRHTRSQSWDAKKLQSSIRAADSILDFISSVNHDNSGVSGKVVDSNGDHGHHHAYSRGWYDTRCVDSSNDPALNNITSPKKGYKSAFPPLSPRGVPTPRSSGATGGFGIAKPTNPGVDVRDDTESINGNSYQVVRTSSSYTNNLRSEVERLRAGQSRVDVEWRDEVNDDPIGIDQNNVHLPSSRYDPFQETPRHHIPQDKEDVESLITVGQDPPDEEEAKIARLKPQDPSPMSPLASSSSSKKGSVVKVETAEEHIELELRNRLSLDDATTKTNGSNDDSEVKDPLEDIAIETKSSSKDYTTLGLLEEERTKALEMLEEERARFAKEKGELMKMLGHEREKHCTEEKDNKIKLAEMEKEKVISELDEEKAKSSDLEKQIKSLRDEIEKVQQIQGESVYNHLQEVRSLRTSLEKATIELEKRSLNCGEEHQQSLKEKEEIEATLRGEFEIKEHCWREEREKLNSEIKDLTEKTWAAQNAEHSLRRELREKEQAWVEEREQLENEIKMLQDSGNPGGVQTSDSFSVTSTLNTNTLLGLGSNSTMGNNDCVGLKMQLDNAIKEADEMRKYNAAIRKEHNETISELENELEQERSSKTELLSQIVTLQYRIATLEQELDDANDNTFNDYGSSRIDSMEADLYSMANKLADTRSEAEASKKALEAAKREFKEKEQSLLEKLHEANFRVRTLESKLSFENQLQDVSISNQEYSRLMNEKERMFEEKEQSYRMQLEETRSSLLDAEHKAKFFEEKEQSLLKQLDEAKRQQKTLQEQERSYLRQLDDAKKQQQTLQQLEATYNQQLQDAKKKIQDLQGKIDEQQHQLWEAKKQQEYAVNDKEDQLARELRAVKKETEKKLIEKDDEHIRQMRELKRTHEHEMRQKEEKYLMQIRELKKQEKFLQEREDELLKQLEDTKLKESFNAMDDRFVEELEEARRREERVVAELTAEIEQLKKESQESADDKMIVDELEQQLIECKKDLERQRRRHKSELNKLNNTLELQKSKESRLQSHIKSMEAQITDMVSDYEQRLQEAFYSNMRRGN
mmetsp:Transcript_20720/g.42283  ORF Transcript_20720/g.42283 Transcript_20720/m.42283 type:complete len:1494 (+) Transcript_20720:61-4542(+)